MERRRLGSTDMVVSVLGFGGSEIGDERTSPAVVRETLDGALDAGLNVIDTAECYGASEELIGEAVAERRDDYYLFTKCGHGSEWGRGDWSAESLLRSIRRSLKRLRTDCVDLIQLHSCSKAELQRGVVIEALKQARKRGYARHIGYSGDGAAAQYAVECGEFDTLQTSVSIADQEAIDRVLPLARERGVGVIAKRPIANVAWHNGNRPPDDEYGRPYWERLRELRYDFLRESLGTSVAIALRFTLGVSGVHTAIVGTTKPGRFAENAKAANAGPLPKEVFEDIRARWHEVANNRWVGQT